MNKIPKPTTQRTDRSSLKICEERRRKDLNIMLAGTMVICAFLSLVLTGIHFSEPALYKTLGGPALLLPCLLVLVASLPLFLLNRYVSSLLASIIFNLVIFLAVIFGDTPEQIIHGRSFVYLVLPLITSALLILPWVGYVVASLVAIGASLVAITQGVPAPDIPALLLLFLIALITQQTLSNLERIVEKEQKNNRLLVESEDRYRKIIETSPNPMVIVDLQGMIKDCNRAFLKSAGFSSKEDLTARDGYQLIHPDEKARTTEIMAQMLQTGSATGMEIKGWREDGVSLLYEFSASMVTDWEGNFSSVVCAFQDITERKRMENQLRESEERFRALIENSSDIVAVVGMDGAIRYASPSVERLLGYSTGEIIGQNIFNYIHPADLDIAAAALKIGIPAEAIGPMLVLRIQHKNGSWCVLEVVGKPMYDHPAIMGTIVNCRSITEQKEIENELRKSNQLLASTLASLDDAVFIVDFSTKSIIECNPAAAQMFGYPRGEILTRAPDFLFVDENAVEEFKIQLNLAMEDKGFLSHFEYRMKQKDGTVFPVECSGGPLYGPDAKQFGWLSVVHDITERKRMEEELRESEEKFAKAFQFNPAPMLINDSKGRYTEVNQAFIQKLGYSQEEIAGHTAAELDIFMEPEQIKRAHEIFRKDGRLRDFEIALRTRSGEIINGVFFSESLRLNKNPIILSVMNDITERKRAEDELRESNQLLEKTLASLKEAVFIIDWDTRLITNCNPVATEMFGYGREEILGRSIDFLHVDPETLAEFRKQLYKAMEEKGFFNAFEFHMKHKDGTVFSTEHSVTALFDEHGKQISWVSVIRNITERKKAELELRESEAQYRLLAENMSDTVWLMNMNLQTIYISPSVTRLRGYTLDEINAIPLDQQMTPDSMNRAMLLFTEALSPENLGSPNPRTTFQLELEFYKKDGTKFWSENTFTLIRDENGQPINILGSGRDITERKKADIKLHESEEKYHGLIDLLPIGVGIHQKGRIVLLNPTGAKLMGAKSQEELLGASVMDFLHPDYRELAQARISKSVAKGLIAGQEEEKFIRRDGTSFDAQVTALPFGMGSEASMLVVFDDITERKQAQEAIVLQNQRIQEVSRLLVEVQEREKHLLAAELHDDLGQSLTSLKLMLELASTTRSSVTRKKELEKVRELVSELMRKVRNLSLDLRPAMLDDFGLFAALRWLFERFQSQTGIAVRCNFDPDSKQRFDPAVETAAFRLIQEALTNVARHASVQEAQVRLTIGNTLSVEIADQGPGFDYAEKASQVTGSRGVAGMQERARLLGGRVDILSGKGSGTRVLAEIPLKGAAA